jgi:hypothetical protein
MMRERSQAMQVQVMLLLLSSSVFHFKMSASIIYSSFTRRARTRSK